MKFSLSKQCLKHFLPVAYKQRYIYFLIFYCILGFGVHEQSMQDSCVGTHMAVCFASFPPSPTFVIFPQAIPPQLPLPRWPSPFPPSRLQCLVLPSLCPCVLIFHHPPMSENMRYIIFCSVSVCWEWCSPDSSMSLQRTQTHHFWLLHNIPWCICATFSQSSLSSMVIWVDSRSLLL